jgi:hypothetical protein
MTTKKPIGNRLTAIIAVLAIGLGTTSTAYADPCGMVPPPPDLELATSVTIERIGVQKTFVAHDKGMETMVLRPGFQGNVEEFGMLIPFPSPPAIRKVDDNIFSHLAAAIDPPEVIARVQRFRPMGRRSMNRGMSAPSAAPKMKKSAERELRFDEVKVVSQEAVGMYEVAVLAAGSPKALKRWMDDNKFRYPEGMDEVVRDYVASKWFFVAVKTKVGSKAGVNPRPGMRNANAKRPAGSTFSGFVQAMGFRFKTKKLVVPMRLSVFNAKGNSRNIVYALTRGGTKIEGIPESFVVRQIPGTRLMRNVVDPLPLRVIGGTKADLSQFQTSQLATRRNPTPHNGLAKELFGADMLAMQRNRLSSPLEVKEKALLNIGESLGLRGRVIDDLNRTALKSERDRLATKALSRLQGMTLSVIDGAFDRDVLAKANLNFKRHRMAASRNTKSKYDAIRQGPSGNLGGKLYLWRVSANDRNQQGEKPGDGVAIAALAGGGDAGGGSGIPTLPLLLLVGLMGMVALRSRKRLLYPAALAGALILASSNVALGQSGSTLSKQLAGEKGATIAATMVAKGDQSVAQLLAVARDKSHPVAQGRAIMALSEVGSTMAEAGLALVGSSTKQSTLVRTWAVAGRMQMAATTSDLFALENMTRTFPATRRPWLKRFRVLLAAGDADSIMAAVARVPELRGEMQDLMRGLPAKKLLSVMLTSNNQQTRQTAASVLGTKKAGTVAALVAKSLRFNKNAKALPWKGGALFMPGIAWPSKSAKQVASHLLRWMIWSEKKNDNQGMRVAANNLMNTSLAKAAGYKAVSGQLGYSTVFWIGLWTKEFGAKEANRVMKDTD